MFDSSWADLVYHDYRLVERADSLRNARVEAELTGRHRDLGQGVDLVLALEEWERIGFEIGGSAIRAGRAHGNDRGEWIYGGFFAFRAAF